MNKQKVAKLIDKLVLAHECWMRDKTRRNRVSEQQTVLKINKIRAKLRKKGIPVDD